MRRVARLKDGRLRANGTVGEEGDDKAARGQVVLRLIAPDRIAAGVDADSSIRCNTPPARLPRGPQFSAPTTAPIRQVDSVPETTVFGPSAIISSRRSGAMTVSPPIMMPSEAKLAKPHMA